MQLDVLDTLASVLLARAMPARFDAVESAATREAVYRLRFATVVEEGWATESDFADGLERDEFDEDAVHVIGRHADQVIAAARLVFPQPGRPLPTERDFELTLQPAGRIVDIGRAIVVKDHRSAEHTLFGALLARCWLMIRELGYQNLCGAASPARLKRYQEFGLPLRIVGPSRWYWSEERYPVFLAGEEFADFVRARGFNPHSLSAPESAHRGSLVYQAARSRRMP